MTATATRNEVRTPSAKGKNSLQAPTRPQVNLLPPEVRAARGLKTVKTWLVVALVAVVLILALAFVAALMARSAAESQLADAKAETTRLLAEEATYAEVPLVLNALESTERAREIGMATEVDWDAYLVAIAAVAPTEVALETMTINGVAASTVPPAPASPLHTPAPSQILFTGVSSTIPDTAAWIDALNGIPGFTDAWVTSADVETTAEGEVPVYRIDGSVWVTDEAFIERFAVTEGEED